jgi:WD40 repeat protein
MSTAPTVGVADGLLSAGRVIGERYQVREVLGRGGMGEVRRAFDLKLRVEVALKALHEDLFQDEQRLELLRREVRAAREVVSPNVCRIFDLVELDARELVSMEYVDGETLLAVLEERGPLELKEAQEIASQFLAGLEAIHQAGLVHCDVKPENIMLTRAGRVVLMDFGLAREEASGAGTVAGTPAYMAPEQATGLELDARADVYAAGVVLAEMVSPEGVGDLESRQSVWQGIRHEPARVPETPWAPVLQKAVAKDREQRYDSAHTLIRALEDVTLRVEGAEDLTPYPGLASFTEEDAEYFFGREAEVEQTWRKLDRPHLLAVVGPSGAGKSSFLRAGLIPSAGEGWAIVRCTPGTEPFRSLRDALIPELSDDTEAIRSRLRIEEPDSAVAAVAAWRARHDNALLIVDQFEELFTLNPGDAQRRFADLLGRLVLEADLFVLLSMRDDFLAQCNALEPLRPIFHELTMLDPPSGPSLRRALVQPAMKCGYRFEDDALVDEMLAEVEGERGALPLVAFAMSRLWESRDRETGLLTRQAYGEIGGVGGALAKHAEGTIYRIGIERLSVVRELFRNLVTAEGTRAVREADELLSVFPQGQRAGAQQVLRELIDARLLTSYEVERKDGAPARRVEIVHESLLANWPRLMRWQRQDAEGAQLRDELRQAARAWDEHDRSTDRLWTGTAYREFELWRERYRGGLSAIEEAFSSAMIEFAGRQRRRRRLAVTAAFVALVAVLAVVSSFWRQSVRETRRAEASNLLSLAQLELDDYPTAAVAYAMASLERAESPRARRLALEALWKGPTAFVVSEEPTWMVAFTPDGHHLVRAQGLGAGIARLDVIGDQGSFAQLEKVHEGDPRLAIYMDREASHFVSCSFPADFSHIALWSAAERRKVSEFRHEGIRALRVVSDQQRIHAAVVEEGSLSVDALRFDGAIDRLGTLDLGTPIQRRRAPLALAPSGRWLGASTGQEIFMVEIGPDGLSEPRFVGRQDSPVRSLAVDPLGRFVATGDAEGGIRLWDALAPSPPSVARGGAGFPYGLGVNDDGTILGGGWIADGRLEVWLWSVAAGELRLLRRIDLGSAEGATDIVSEGSGRRIAKWGPDTAVRLWSLSAPADAEPLVLSRGQVQGMSYPAFHPEGRWLATSDRVGAALWPLARPYPSVVRRHREDLTGLAFGPQGRWLASASFDGTVRLWPLVGEAPPSSRVVLDLGFSDYALGLASSPDGELLIAGSFESAWLLSLGGRAPLSLRGFRRGAWAGAFSPDGRLVAAAGGKRDPTEQLIRVWDVLSGEEAAVLDPGESLFWEKLHFATDGRLLYSSESGLHRWDLESGDNELLYEGLIPWFAASADGGRLLLVEVDERDAAWGRALLLELETGTRTPLTTHGDRVTGVALDADGTIAVTADNEGIVRVGRSDGEEPHLLLGHEELVYALAIDPEGRWVASGGADATIRIWPMPDLDRAPLHTLPRSELLAKLSTLTNLRVLPDESSDSGWRLAVGLFRGWEEVPEW